MYYAGGGCACCLVFTTILFVIIALMIGVCSPDNYCLNFNAYEQTVGTSLYDGGRYLIGINHHFIEFPRKRLAYIMNAEYTSHLN